MEIPIWLLGLVWVWVISNLLLKKAGIELGNDDFGIGAIITFGVYGFVGFISLLAYNIIQWSIQ